MPGLSGGTRLPDSGAVVYGAFQFPADTLTTELSVRPVWDRAQRTVIYNRIRIGLRCRLTGRAIDANVREATRILSKPAYPLLYAGRGYGFAVNVGGVRDVVWGPKPVELSVKPLGGGNAVELTWTVEACVPDAAVAKYQFAGMEFGFTVTYDVDGSGYTTREYEAYLVIPQTRRNALDRTLTDTADRYREDIYPPQVEGFRRIPGTTTVSLDKCRIDLRGCQDIQMPPNVPPPGVIEVTGSHTISNPKPVNMKEWTGTVEASYEIARNQRASWVNAAVAFWALVGDRVKHLIDRSVTLGPSELRAGLPGETQEPPRVPCLVPLTFTMSEPEIYGKTVARFALAYRFTDIGLGELIGRSGLWTPVKGSNWREWAASVEGILGSRGHAGLILDVGDDKIVDLLQPGLPVTDLSNRRRRALERNPAAVPPGVFPEPTPEGSYLYYKNEVFFECDNGIAPVSTLPTELRSDQGDMFGGGAAVNLGDVGRMTVNGIYAALLQVPGFGFYNPPARPGTKPKTGGQAQRRAKQSGYLYLIGMAVRVRYGIPTPALTRWGDKPLTPANRPGMGEGVWAGAVGNVGYPVYRSAWRLRYWCEEIPAGVALPVPPNPTLGADGLGR